jgi:outer membrane protein
VKRIALSMLFPTALAAQAGADSVARPISLDDAVRLAQRNAPSAVQASGNVRVNSATVRSAYMAFIPSLSVSSGATKQGGDRFDSQGQLVPFTGSAWSYNSGLTLNLQLFDGGNRLFELRAAKANVNAAEANETLQQYNVSLNVKQQYFAVLAAKESEAAARAQFDQAAEQLKTASAKVAAGAATKSDSLRAVIQVGNAQLALLQAQNNLNIANASLTRLVATPFVVTASPEDSAQSMTLNADSAAIAGLALRGPAVRQAEQAFGAARANVRGSLTSYLPTITLNYNRGGNGLDSRFGWGDNRYAYSETMRFNLQFPFFNQGTREETIVRSRVAEDNAEAQLRDMRFLAQQQLTQYLSAFRTAEQRAQIQLASVAAAEEDLRVQQRRYQLGASTFLDVLNSQVTLNQARSALIQARFDARVAKAQIETLTGRDL